MNRQIIVTLAKETAKIYLHEGITIATTADMPEWLCKNNYGVYIIFLDYAKNIRSQAGSVVPTTSCLGEEIIKQTINSLKGNNIFKPIDKNEINGLKLAVYIILKQEAIYNLALLDPEKDGLLVVKSKKENYGLALPQKISADDLVKIACHNGKIDYKNDNYKIFRLTIKKYIE